MGKITVNGLQDFSKQLTELAESGIKISKMALYDGAAVLADRVKANINALPTTSPNRPFMEGEKYSVVTPTLKAELVQSFGISRMREEGSGVNLIMGFNTPGYSSVKTKKYPNGLPLPMIARSIESGSSVRQKHPFVRPAVNAAKAAAQAAMERTAFEQIDKIIK